MKMSDKDFDQLFNGKLGDMEIEPSAHVWDNIVDELDGKKDRKKGGLPFMQIAAGVIVLMAVGLYFLKPASQKIALHALASTQAEVTAMRAASTITPVIKSVDTSNKNLGESLAAFKHQLEKEADRPMKKQAMPTQPENTPMIANVTTSQPTNDVDIHKVDIPKITAQAQVLTTESVIGANVITVKQPIVIVQNTKEIKEPVKKRRIHTLGDLLNVVIAKVDKREDKLIQFTNDSDDDSFNLTGVNLGIINAKKDK